MSYNIDLKYYRPEWTCGRYQEECQAAIYYNLIEGMSYYFEDHSARIIGFILSTSKQSFFTLAQLSDYTGISSDILYPFLEQLRDLGIIATRAMTPKEIKEYRRIVSCKRKEQGSVDDRTVSEKLPIALSNAEADYARRTGGITSVMLELTYRCSEKCIHCYNPGATRNEFERSHRGEHQEMTLDDYKRVIDELYQHGLIKVCLTGGDPFVRPIIWEIIDYLKTKDIAFDIYTNAQMLIGMTEVLASKYPRLVGVSIYSGIPEEHDYITRIKGSWDKSIKIVEELSELAVPINLKCCIMKPNVNSYYMVGDLAKQYGAVVQYEVSVTDSIDGDKCVSRYLRMSPEEYEIVLRDSDIPLYVGPEAPDFGRQMRNPNENPCGAGDNSFCITPDGYLIPCCSLHLKFGNLCKESLDAILQSETLLWWRNLKLADYEECGKYDYCDYCNLCPGNNFSQWGTPLKASENNCYIAKVRYGLAKRMRNDSYDPLGGKSLIEVLKSLHNSKLDIKREISR